MALKKRWSKSKRVTGPRFKKLNKDAVRSADNMPNYNYRRSQADDIPSLKIEGHIDADLLGRNSMVERVRRGEIVGPEADEIMRKSKCLAPAYNKGAYQYVGSKDQASEAGRKTPKGSER